MTSLSGFQGAPWLTTYGATKAFNLVLAEGLWQEMEADLYAENAVEALQVAISDAPVSNGEQRTINRRKRRRPAAAEGLAVHA